MQTPLHKGGAVDALALAPMCPVHPVYWCCLVLQNQWVFYLQQSIPHKLIFFSRHRATCVLAHQLCFCNCVYRLVPCAAVCFTITVLSRCTGCPNGSANLEVGLCAIELRFTLHTHTRFINIVRWSGPSRLHLCGVTRG